MTAASVGPSKAAAEADRETRQPEINITEVSHEWSPVIVYIRISTYVKTFSINIYVFHVKEINKSGVWSSLEPKVEEPCEKNIIGLGKPPSKDNSPDDGIVIKVGVNTRVSYLDIRM